MPIRHGRVMDLVAAAGVDISDWANYAKGKDNPAANPNYCYSWCFVEPDQVVVLNLWFDELKEQDGVVFQELNCRSLANTFERNPARSTWARRARAMDLALQRAWREKLTVKVIVCDGSRYYGTG